MKDLRSYLEKAPLDEDAALKIVVMIIFSVENINFSPAMGNFSFDLLQPIRTNSP